MDDFLFRGNEVYCEQVSLTALARDYGTPVFVYSRQTLRRHLTRLSEAFASYPTLACYAVKANSNLAILAEAARYGLGADVVSGGELQRALRAGVLPNSIVFSGVGKKQEELRLGLEVGILSFNVESLFELDRLAELATSMGVEARVSVRVNPNIHAETHANITTGLHDTKFGLPVEALPEALDRIRAHRSSLRLVGLSCHIGSQIIRLDPLRRAARTMREIAEDVRRQGFALDFLDLGGGLGIRYSDETPPDFPEYAQALIEEMRGSDLRLIVEPGRVVVGNAGILVTQVIGVKTTPSKTFVVVDAAMNDLARPALYGAFHAVEPVCRGGERSDDVVVADVVGPICETTDTLARNRTLPRMSAGEYLFFRSAGAYGASMASNYNTRPRAAEIMVDGEEVHVIRKRERIEDLWDLEMIP